MTVEVTPDQLTETQPARSVGCAVVALACDPEMMARSGGVFKAGQPELDYGFTDVDGSQPVRFTIPPWRHDV